MGVDIKLNKAKWVFIDRQFTWDIAGGLRDILGLKVVRIYLVGHRAAGPQIDKNDYAHKGSRTLIHWRLHLEVTTGSSLQISMVKHEKSILDTEYKCSMEMSARPYEFSRDPIFRNVCEIELDRDRPYLVEVLNMLQEERYDEFTSPASGSGCYHCSMDMACRIITFARNNQVAMSFKSKIDRDIASKPQYWVPTSKGVFPDRRSDPWGGQSNQSSAHLTVNDQLIGGSGQHD